MWFTFWLQIAKRVALRDLRRPQGKRSAFRLQLETLEDRALPSTNIAANVSDLIHDIIAVNQASGPAASPYVFSKVNNTKYGKTVLPVIAKGGHHRSTILLPGKLRALLGVAACLIVAYLPAVARQNDQKPREGPLKGDAIEIAEVKPASPATLKVGEKLEIRFSYSLESADQAVIIVHPTTKSKYRPHPVAAYKKGKGQGVGWFLFDGPASVEEVQIKMVDLKTQKTLVLFKHAVKAEWK